ncbi:alkylation response protein AidB-like acyl-CoA dehydrogenase [Paraburkholderia sp. WC7.3d]
MAVEYANVRVQFGRSIGSFRQFSKPSQLATQTAAARVAAEAGRDAIDDWPAADGVPLAARIAAVSAKVRTGRPDRPPKTALVGSKLVCYITNK